MTTLALEAMAQRLTTPFARGASTLTLSLIAGGNATQAQVSPYDFSEYTALFGGLPAPSYILVAQQDIPVPTQVTVDYIKKSATSSITLAVPPGTSTGTSFADWRRSDGTPASLDLKDPDIQL